MISLDKNALLKLQAEIDTQRQEREKKWLNQELRRRQKEDVELLRAEQHLGKLEQLWYMEAEEDRKAESKRKALIMLEKKKKDDAMQLRLYEERRRRERELETIREEEERRMQTIAMRRKMEAEDRERQIQSAKRQEESLKRRRVREAEMEVQRIALAKQEAKDVIRMKEEKKRAEIEARRQKIEDERRRIEERERKRIERERQRREEELEQARQAEEAWNRRVEEKRRREEAVVRKKQLEEQREKKMREEWQQALEEKEKRDREASIMLQRKIEEEKKRKELEETGMQRMMDGCSVLRVTSSGSSKESSIRLIKRRYTQGHSRDDSSNDSGIDNHVSDGGWSWCIEWESTTKALYQRQVLLKHSVLSTGSDQGIFLKYAHKLKLATGQAACCLSLTPPPSDGLDKSQQNKNKKKENSHVDAMPSLFGGMSLLDSAPATNFIGDEDKLRANAVHVIYNTSKELEAWRYGLAKLKAEEEGAKEVYLDLDGV